MQPESRTAFLDDYRAIADAIRIESDSRYRIGDMERDLDRIRIASAPDAAAPSPTLRMLLQNDIYGLLYKRAGRFNDADAFSGDKSEFLIALSHANCGTGTWEPGWRIVSSTATGDVRVVSGDRCDSVVFDAGIDDIELPPDVAAAEGVRCRMRIPKELRQLNAHYYMAFGDARLLDQRDAQDVLLRYY